jgi:GT2 family glycosyltransferase
MQRTRTVCVGVPVWRGADHVAETLESVRRQRGVGLTIVVSVDGDDEESVAACRPFLADPRVSLLVQPRRLGWVGNSSAVLAAAAAGGADYACLQPHDDLLDDDYLAVLLAAAEANSHAAVVYSDIQSFGTQDTLIRQPPVAGSPFERQIDVLRNHYAAVSYRGLMRVSALRSILPMAGNPCEDFAADTVWLARQALVGNLVRVPHALYRKRYHPNNTHSRWATWSAELRMMAWSRHCLDMLAEALKASSTASERRTLHKEARTRLLHPQNGTPYRSDLHAMPPLAQAGMRSRFDAAAALRADIGPPPETRFRAGLRAVRVLRSLMFRHELRDHHGGEGR